MIKTSVFRIKVSILGLRGEGMFLWSPFSVLERNGVRERRLYLSLWTDESSRKYFGSYR